MDAGIVVYEAADGSVGALEVSSGHRSTVTSDVRLLPVRRTSSATSGAETPTGSMLLAPGGRLGRPSDGRRLDAAARTVDRLGEVAP